MGASIPTAPIYQRPPSPFSPAHAYSAPALCAPRTYARRAASAAQCACAHGRASSGHAPPPPACGTPRVAAAHAQCGTHPSAPPKRRGRAHRPNSVRRMRAEGAAHPGGALRFVAVGAVPSSGPAHCPVGGAVTQCPLPTRIGRSVSDGAGPDDSASSSRSAPEVEGRGESEAPPTAAPRRRHSDGGCAALRRFGCSGCGGSHWAGRGGGTVGIAVLRGLWVGFFGLI